MIIIKNIFRSLIVLGLVGAFAFAVTQSFFSDREESKGNVLVAGALDLKVDNESYYNGNKCTETSEGSGVWQWVGNAVYPVAGTECTTSWKLSDLPGKLFFNFTDLKPDDEGEDTISLHAENDAWVCMDLTLTSDNDISSTTPELIVDDPEVEGNIWDGELGGLLQMIWWADDGDNVLEEGEPILVNGTPSTPLPITSLFGGDNKFSVTLADSTANAWGLLPGTPLPANTTKHIAKGWCFGTMTLNQVPQQNGISPNGPLGPGFTCNGVGLGNESQTDGVTMDVQFSAIQARHNPNFKCNGNGGLPCDEEVDVMLVLDRSASIDAGELTTLKNAALAFVDALNPSPSGAHIGLVSFGTTATLDQTLTDSEATIDAAINAVSVSSGSFTNLQDGILDATTALSAGRPTDVMVIITDGAPTASNGNPNGPVVDPLPLNTHSTAALNAANAADGAGIEIFVAGVGTNATTETYLEGNIATDPAHFFGVVDFDDLEAVLAALIDCPNGGGGVTPTPTPTPTPVSLFSDGFGTGTIDSTFNESPVWTEGGPSSDDAEKRASGSGNDSASPDGGRFALIQGNGSWLCRTVNTAGYNTVLLSYYWRGDSSANNSDRGIVEIKPSSGNSCSDASGWTTLQDHNLNDDSTWSTQSPFGNAGMENISFLLRFRAASNSTSDDFRVDGVSLTGIP